VVECRRDDDVQHRCNVEGTCLETWVVGCRRDDDVQQRCNVETWRQVVNGVGVEKSSAATQSAFFHRAHTCYRAENHHLRQTFTTTI
jgi:hypothetical protein